MKTECPRCLQPLNETTGYTTLIFDDVLEARGRECHNLTHPLQGSDSPRIERVNAR